jgi:hypothetical protein
MGLKQRIIDLLSRGEVPEADPDELVDVDTVALAHLAGVRGSGVPQVAHCW